MKYIIADRMKAAQAGLSIRGCLRNDEHIIFDEKELNIIPGETLEDRATAIGGTIYTLDQIEKLIKKGDW